jgi:hypothetical protein
MGTEIVNSRYQVLTTPPAIQGDPREGLFTPTAAQQYRLGTKLFDNHGRVWRYGKNAGTELAVALMAQSEAQDAQSVEQLQTGYTTSIGQTKIKALLATGSAITDGELADGWLVANKSTGLGYCYPIKWNEWLTSDTVMSVELYEPIRVATAATTEWTFIINRWSNVLVMPTTVTGIAAGVPNVVIPANYYGWLQTKGYCPMTVDAGDTLVIGCAVGNPGTNGTAGAVGVPAITTQIWGHCVYIATAGETALVDLNLE